MDEDVEAEKIRELEARIALFKKNAMVEGILKEQGPERRDQTRATRVVQ